MPKVLWIAPNLNHYKARFLKRLSKEGAVELTVLAGTVPSSLGHRPGEDDEAGLNVVRLGVPKSKFHAAPEVYRRLLGLVRELRPEVLLMPSESKFLPLIIFSFLLAKAYGFSLVSYTHPGVGRKKAGRKRLNRFLSKAVFAMYDRVIFYTEQSMDHAVAEGLVSASKASFANNTLDTDSIKAVYDYVPPPTEPSILFIGRLIPSKRLDTLLEYYRELKKRIPDLRLTVVGDGPEAPTVRAAAEKDPDLDWKGALVDEAAIAEVMRGIQLVFLPGHSGLSIVHAFCYGRPYATIGSSTHPPEIAYLEDGVNGLVLSGEFEQDLERLEEVLRNRQLLETYCRNAYDKAGMLSIGRWLGQMAGALRP